MAKKKSSTRLQAGHPFREAGFLSEADVRDAWKFSESYFRDGLRKEHVPYCTIAGERWFHPGSLVAWFNAKAMQGEKDASE